MGGEVLRKIKVHKLIMIMGCTALRRNPGAEGRSGGAVLSGSTWRKKPADCHVF